MTLPSLIDTHCHLDFAVFDHDRDAILKRCQQQNIEHIIVPSVSAANWCQTIAVCSQYKNTHLALGLHPLFINQHQPQHLIELDAAVTNNLPIAIGEIGLDFYQMRDRTNELEREKQLLFFTKQLIIANRHRLPVIIHNRKAHDDCLNLLTKMPNNGGIIHAFNGSIQQAEKYIDLGFLLGFGGMVTYARSNKLRNLVKRLPLSSIVLETDAPDMTVAQHQGQRNSPEYIPHILQAIAQIKQLDTADVALATSANVNRVLQLDSSVKLDQKNLNLSTS